MRLTNYTIHPQLKGHVQKLWVFENDEPVPQTDLRVIVPNGLVKIVIPFRNGLKATLNGRDSFTSAHEITLIGIADIPSVVVDLEQKASGTIGIEFSAFGAHRFFNLSLEEIKNRVTPLTEILGKTARGLKELIANEENVRKKVLLIQKFLLQQFQLHPVDDIFEFCVKKILDSQGTIQISELEKLTGYSSRWLNMKFYSRLGISPKNFCSIIRFQHIYNDWARTNFTSFHGSDVYRFYHDQAHFIKDFKRFTGYSPSRFQTHDNQFGRIFYKG